MFGVAVARLDQIDEAERDRYQAFYCGLCRSLKERYGQVSRAALSYDLVFFAILCDSLHDASERSGNAHCIAHPKKQMPFIMSSWTDRAADLSVALAYHKCLDDVVDDDSLKAKAASVLLKSSYEKAYARIPHLCDAIAYSMERTHILEADPDTPPDAVALEFGSLLGELFGDDQGLWSDTMRQFGRELGQFVYLMDAAVDFQADSRNGSYNPFVRLDTSPEQMRAILMNLIGAATHTFEKLPIIDDVHLLRCVLYAGVWQKFNHTYEDSCAVDENVGDEEEAEPS